MLIHLEIPYQTFQLGGCWCCWCCWCCWSPCCGQCCPPSVLTELLTRLDLSWLSSLKCWWQLLALLMLTPTLPLSSCHCSDTESNQWQSSAPAGRHLRANPDPARWETFSANGPHYSAHRNYVHFVGQVRTIHHKIGAANSGNRKNILLWKRKKKNMPNARFFIFVKIKEKSRSN